MRTSYLKDLLQRADEALEQAQEASRRMSACQDTLRLICATISVQIDLQTDNESMVGKPKEFRHLFVPTSLTTKDWDNLKLYEGKPHGSGK